MKQKLCCIRTCQNERFDLAHKFPRYPERAEMWLEAIDSAVLKQVPLPKLSQIYQVCSRHFRLSDYKHALSRSLNTTAVPSLNLKDLSELHLSRDSTAKDLKQRKVHSTKQEIIKAEPCVVAENAPISTQLCNEHLADFESVDMEYERIEAVQIVEELEENISLEEFPTAIEEDPKVKTSFEEFPTAAEEDRKESDSGSFSTFFEMHHPKYENTLLLNSYWLRCHCRCSICYDPMSLRRKISPIDIPTKVEPKSVGDANSLDVILIEWDDGHKSEHDVNFLFNTVLNKKAHSISRMPWRQDSDDILAFSKIEFSELVTSDERIELAFWNLSQLGVTMIQNIPMQSLAMAKLAVCRLFPQLEYIQFEQFNETHSDVCTNVTYSNADCGLKCFFVTEQVKMILVDGLNAAQELQALSDKAFKTLTQVAVPLEIRESNVMWKSTAPIIETDSAQEILRLRLDVHRIGLFNTVPQEKYTEFYESLRQFIEITKDTENQWSLTLMPGTMVILDSWRIFHKCLMRSGISQFYVDRKDYVSRVRFLELV